MASVTLSRVRKSFGTTEVVHGVDITIDDGEFCVLVGPSGCGKSTLLRMIAGLEEITDGEIKIGGRIVNQVPPKERDIAMVFQNYALYPHMTVFDNMAFSLRLAGRPRAEMRSRVGAAASILGLTEYLERYPRQLSGGQRQRVAMGRATLDEVGREVYELALAVARGAPTKSESLGHQEFILTYKAFEHTNEPAGPSCLPVAA